MFDVYIKTVQRNRLEIWRIVFLRVACNVVKLHLYYGKFFQQKNKFHANLRKWWTEILTINTSDI